MKAHIRTILADGDAAAAEYILNWTAWAFQNPATPPKVALAFRGGEGTGKGIFLTALCRVFGHHALRIQSMGHLTGRFNSHLRHLCFLFADEAVVPSGESEGGALKGLISESTIPIEQKFHDLESAQNHLHIALASNHDFVVPAGKDARRFCVFDVSSKRQGDKEYFRALAQQMEKSGDSAMLHDLLNHDLKGFHPEHDRIETDALSDQKANTLEGFERVWLDLLRAGEVPSRRWIGTGRPFVATSDLRQYAARRMKRDDVSLQEVASLLNELGYEKDDNARPRGWPLPTLAEARAAWNKKRFPVRWGAQSCWARLGEDEGLVNHTGFGSKQTVVTKGVHRSCRSHRTRTQLAFGSAGNGSFLW
jgi:hypothetical protein